MESLKAVRQFVKEAGGDGHSICSPKFFLDMGFSEQFVKRSTYEHESDGSHKGNIFSNGKKVAKLEGVYTLDFAYEVAKDIGADMNEALSKIGRGFQAGCLATAINKKLTELGA